VEASIICFLETLECLEDIGRSLSEAISKAETRRGLSAGVWVGIIGVVVAIIGIVVAITIPFLPYVKKIVGAAVGAE
jgi:hypothetical protein